MDVSPEELKAFQRATDNTEIQQLFGRYATLMDQMDAMGIYNELMAKDDPEVSVEYTCNGRYDGFVLFRHILRSSEIVVVDVSESEDEFLQLLDHLHEDLIVA